MQVDSIASNQLQGNLSVFHCCQYQSSGHRFSAAGVIGNKSSPRMLRYQFVQTLGYFFECCIRLIGRNDDYLVLVLLKACQRRNIGEAGAVIPGALFDNTALPVICFSEPGLPVAKSLPEQKKQIKSGLFSFIDVRIGSWEPPTVWTRIFLFMETQCFNYKEVGKI